MSDAVVLRPGEGETWPIGPTWVRFLAVGSDTDGQASFEEMGIGAGFGGPPLHVHRNTSHAWYVIEGELVLTVGETSVAMTHGGFMFVPAGVSHTFGNQSATEARLLQISLPAGFEDYLKELRQSFPPGSDVDSEKIVEIMGRHDTFPAQA